MPKQTQLEQSIPDIYKASALNLSFFAFVKGVKAALPAVTVAEAIDMFLEAYEIREGDLNRLTLMDTYTRMQKKLVQNIKSKP